MKEVSNFVIDRCFNIIWEFWPNKSKGEHAPRKAITVALRSGHSEQDLINACRIYTHLSEGEDIQYVKQLNNFINQNEWMDILEGNSLEALERQRQEALEVVLAWNAACRSHWNKVLGIDSRVPIAKIALQDKEFKKNWKKSLDIARNIFHYRFNDSDIRSKINLTFAWFTNVSLNKHTVLKILEGDYGKPEKQTHRKTVTTKDVTQEERARLAMDFEEVFGRKLPIKEKESPPAPDRSERSEPDLSIRHSEDSDPFGFH